jgi:hypothetical protein
MLELSELYVLAFNIEMFWPLRQKSKVAELRIFANEQAIRLASRGGEFWCRQQSRQSFRHAVADAIFLTPLTLLAVPTFEFFSDVLHWRAYGHGRWVTE